MKIKNLLTAIVFAAWSISAMAEATEANVKKLLQPRLGDGAVIESVTKTPYAGLYEVKIGDELVYTDADAKFIMIGRLVDAQSSKDLTQARLDEINRIKFSDLPLEAALKSVKGNGKRVIAVFEDPNCGYCKRFEADLQKLDDVTIYLYLYPILGSDSTVKSKNIWCAADKNKAWTAWMLKNEVPASANSACNTEAITRNVEIGKKFKITGTPTVIFQNGTRVPGAIPLEKLKEAIAERS